MNQQSNSTLWAVIIMLLIGPANLEMIAGNLATSGPAAGVVVTGPASDGKQPAMPQMPAIQKETVLTG